jgi:glycosyltransferase involved in cell wall biosynthesis
MTAVCLNMITRNEAPVIERCLQSVLPFITHYAIVDNSEDETTDIIRRVCKGLHGVIVNPPWIDFAQGRNDALQLARLVTGRPTASEAYALVIDADEVWQGEFNASNLMEDAYAVMFRQGRDHVFWKRALIKLSVPWYWQGAVHEVLKREDLPEYRSAILDGVTVNYGMDGHRSGDPEKFAKAAKVLEKVLERNPSDLRAMLYYAQSLMAAGDMAKALTVYAARAVSPVSLNMVDVEGTFEAFWKAGLIAETLGLECVTFYKKAHETLPIVAEPLVALANYLNKEKRYQEAVEYATMACGPDMHPPYLPTNIMRDLTIEWKARVVLAYSHLNLGHVDMARKLWFDALEIGVPEPERAAIMENLQKHRGAHFRLGCAITKSLKERTK